ncbi:MAG TPA: VOC family protein [Flavobacterium sp.]|nr:VOC family protein [Flavobacterium sp.]
MASLNPYLLFDDTCEAAFNLYKSVFGGDFIMMAKFKDMPPAEDCAPMSEADGEKVMHVSMAIGDTYIMGSDNPQTSGEKTIMGNSVSISINADSKAEADRIFSGLSAGGKISMAMNDTFWGAYFGMFTDKFGIHWMVNFDEKPSKA